MKIRNKNKYLLICVIFLIVLFLNGCNQCITKEPNNIDSSFQIFNKVIVGQSLFRIPTRTGDGYIFYTGYNLKDLEDYFTFIPDYDSFGQTSIELHVYNLSGYLQIRGILYMVKISPDHYNGICKSISFEQVNYAILDKEDGK